jgi:DNA-binding transcriptional MerR regulator
MKYLDIAKVADRTGVPASALRFYEEKDPIAPLARLSQFFRNSTAVFRPPWRSRS